MKKSPNLNFIKKYPLIFKKYKPIKKIATGAFSEVYGGMNIIENTKIAMKIENKNSKRPSLQSESFFLYSLKGLGIPQILSYGVNKEYNILVMPLLGKNLLEIYKEKNLNFSLSDICLIAIQILDRIEYIHNKNIIHKDIKPENFLIGLNDPDLIYLIDFGLSKKYKSSRTGNHIRFQNIMKFTGNIRYASCNALRGWEQSRRDDLESIGYMLIFFLKGTLPWQNFKLKNNDSDFIKIGEFKKNIKPQKLCEGLSKEFIDYMDYVKNLNFEQNPDYNYLKNLFKNLLFKKKLNIQNFSWIINDDPFDDSRFHKRVYASVHRKSCPRQRLYNQIKERLSSLSKSNNENGTTNNLSNNPMTTSCLPRDSCNYIKYFAEDKGEKFPNMRKINYKKYNIENNKYFNYQVNNTEYDSPNLVNTIVNDNFHTNIKSTISKEYLNENFYNKTTGYKSYKENKPNTNIVKTAKINAKNVCFFPFQQIEYNNNINNMNNNELNKNPYIKNATVNLYESNFKNQGVNIYNNTNNITLINNKPIINNYNIINNNYSPLRKSQNVSKEKSTEKNRMSQNFMKVINAVKNKMPRFQKRIIKNINLKTPRTNVVSANNTYTKVNIKKINALLKTNTEAKAYKINQNKNFKKNKYQNYKSDGYRYNNRRKPFNNQDEHCLIM